MLLRRDEIRVYKAYRKPQAIVPKRVVCNKKVRTCKNHAVRYNQMGTRFKQEQTNVPAQERSNGIG